ncbi:glucosyl transferase [Streptococcus dentiloxodontae]
MMKDMKFLSRQYAKRYVITLSCVTALTAAVLISQPAFAETEATATTPSTEVITTAETNNDKTVPSSENSSVKDTDNTISQTSETSESAPEASSEVISETTASSSESDTDKTQAESSNKETSPSDALSTETTANETAAKGYHSDEQGNWYYTDENGEKLTGAQTINGDHVYFDENGVQVKGAFASDGHYYDPDTGAMWTSRFVSTGDNHWYYIDENGNKVTGLQTIDGKTYHFDDNGLQTKDARVVIDGKGYYFHPDSGELWNNKLRKVYRHTYVNGSYDELWYYYDNDGNIYEGPLTLDGKEYYFTPGEVRWKVFKNPDGTESFYNEDGVKVYNDWGSIRYMFTRGYLWTPKIYLDENGHVVHGFRNIDGHLYYFDEYGSLRDDVPGSPKPLFEVDGNQYFADFYREYGDTRAAILTNRIFTYKGITYSADETGKLTKVTDRKQYINVGNDWYYVDADGSILKGEQTIDDVKVYFDKNGKQVKGAFADNGHYYDKDTGAMWVNRPIEVDGVWHYLNQDGEFVKGAFANNGHYYDKDTGAMLTNRYVEADGNWYYVNQNGDKLYGAQTIDSVQVYFDQNGVQVKGTFASDGHYYDPDTGAMWTSRFVSTGDNHWYYVNDKGDKVTGLQTIDGKTYHFDDNGLQTKGSRVLIDGKGYYFHPDSGELWNNKLRKVYRNTYVDGTYDEVWYYYDNDGNIYKGPLTLDGKEYYFTPDEVIEDTLKNPDGSLSYYGKDGAKVYKDWGTLRLMYLRGYNWTVHIYLDENGHVVHGFRTIDGKLYYFNESGWLENNPFVGSKSLFTVDGNQYFADFHEKYGNTYAAILTNRIFTYEGVTYSADETGKLTKVTDE